jgi:hypothetical protein
MIEVKLFEVRDRGTLIPMLAMRVSALHSGKDWHEQDCDELKVVKLIARAGFGESGSIAMLHLGEPKYGWRFNAYDWRDRTFHAAHLYVEQHWDELRSGDLIDVRVVLGEARLPCESEL